MTNRLVLFILTLFTFIQSTTAQETERLQSLLLGEWTLITYTFEDKPDDLFPAGQLTDVPRTLFFQQELVLKTDDKSKTQEGTWHIEAGTASSLSFKFGRKKETYPLIKLDNDELVLYGPLRLASNPKAYAYLIFKKKPSATQPAKKISEAVLPGEWPTCAVIERTAQMDTVPFSRDRDCVANCTYYLNFRHHNIAPDTYAFSKICQSASLKSEAPPTDKSGTWTLDETNGILFLKNENGLTFKFSVWMQDEEMVLMQVH